MDYRTIIAQLDYELSALGTKKEIAMGRQRDAKSAEESFTLGLDVASLMGAELALLEFKLWVATHAVGRRA